MDSPLTRPRYVLSRRPESTPIACRSWHRLDLLMLPRQQRYTSIPQRHCAMCSSPNRIRSPTQSRRSRSRRRRNWQLRFGKTQVLNPRVWR